MGIDPAKAIAVVDIFDDAQQVTLDSLERINKLLFSNREQKTEAQSGDGITVDGVKGADDYNAEQNRENETAK
jgi:hypothetical protein